VQGERLVDVERSALAVLVAAHVADGWRFAMLVGLDDRGSPWPAASGAPAIGGPGGAGFAVEVVLERPAEPILRLRAALPADEPSYASVGRLVPAALWDEREVKDLFGIVPEGHPDPRRLVLHETYPKGFHPLRVDAPAEVPEGSTDRHYVPFAVHGEGVYQLPVGPIHAGVIEPGHFRFSVIGESVLFLDARLFFTHRGIEKLVEGRSFERALPIVERACGVCGVAHALAFSIAVERLAGTVVPDRADRLRAILAEFERLYNHVGDLGNMCAGIGFNVGSSQLGWLKERLLRTNESLTGHRYLAGAVAPGGLAIEPGRDALSALPDRLVEVEGDLRAALRAVAGSEFAADRFRATGHVPRETALRLGAAGVAARASGLAMDLRRDHPTGAYGEFRALVCTSDAGDAAARFDVRAHEAQASIDLLRELLADLPEGPTRVPVGPVEPGRSALGWAEGPRGASWLWLRAGDGGTVNRLHLRSASFANWPVVAAAAPGNLVPDFPLINKSFELCYACTDR